MAIRFSLHNLNTNNAEFCGYKSMGECISPDPHTSPTLRISIFFNLNTTKKNICIEVFIMMRNLRGKKKKYICLL